MARIIEEVREEAREEMDADMPLFSPPATPLVVSADPVMVMLDDEGDSPPVPGPRGEDPFEPVLLAFAERISSTKDCSWRLSSRMWGSRLLACGARNEPRIWGWEFAAVVVVDKEAEDFVGATGVEEVGVGMKSE